MNHSNHIYTGWVETEQKMGEKDKWPLANSWLSTLLLVDAGEAEFKIQTDNQHKTKIRGVGYPALI